MDLKPRYWVLSILLSLGLLNTSSYAAGTATDPNVLHILNRLSFGPRPGDIERVKSMGIDKYIQEQLAPESIPESPELKQQLDSLETLHKTPVELFQDYGRPPTLPGQKPTREEIRAARQRSRIIVNQAMQARLLRATESSRQLQEVMVDFWYNHFNVFNDKGLDRLWVGAYEEEAIRPYALGQFRQLLEATARHPAMLYYLDNWQNTAPNSPGARGKGLNENYARELMELHTLGVDGGYTQQDVIALARILTGWGLRNPRQTNNPYEFYFDDKRHDFGDKVFLGHTIKGSGQAEVEQALDILAKSPTTAHHISYQLAQYFVADQLPASLVDRLAQRFQQTDGDIRAVLDTLFHSPEFSDPKFYNAKFKTPLEYVVSSVRAAGVPVTNTKPMTTLLQQLGMPLYGYLTPDGYKNTQEAWLNPDAMTRRLSFATALANGNLPLNVPSPENRYKSNLPLTPEPISNHEPMPTASPMMPMIEQMMQQMISRDRQPEPVNGIQLANTLGNNFSPQTNSVIASSAPQMRAALILGSPEFMHR